MIRYGFNLKTRSGQRVDNIHIVASSQADAERRLRQMYHHCEILECHAQTVQVRSDPLDLEGVIGIISNDPTVPVSLKRQLLDKAGAH